MAVSIPQLQADLADASLVIADLRAQLKAEKAKPPRVVKEVIEKPVVSVRTVEVPAEVPVERVVYRDRIVPSDPKIIETVREVIKEVPVEVVKYKRHVVTKEVPVEVVKEVPVEVIKEVPVDRIVYRDRLVRSEPKVIETVREVVKEVPVEVVKYKRRIVVKEVQLPPVTVTERDPADIAKIDALAASNAALRQRIADLEANPITIIKHVMVD